MISGRDPPISFLKAEIKNGGSKLCDELYS